MYYLPDFDFIIECPFDDAVCFYNMNDVTEIYQSILLGEL
jgi:hypothetical protein